jgi:large repetitive protein
MNSGIPSGRQNVASGRCHDNNTEAIRYTETGAVDTTFSRPLFNFAGVVGCGVSDAVSGVAVQADGKIVLAGDHSVTCTSTFENALIRLNTDGSLDSTFGSGGIVRNKLPSNTEGYSRVLIQSDRKIVAAGITSGTTTPTFNTVSNLTLSRYLVQ